MQQTPPSESSVNPAVPRQNENMRQFYRWHAALYDATRWTFLRGRNDILERLQLSTGTGRTVLEVGCGTGRNLRRLAGRHPELQLMGMDVSPDMLKRAMRATKRFSRRVLLFEQAYGASTPPFRQPYDTVLFSYALTMFNPGWEAAIERAFADLPAGGRIAVVDFHDTPSKWFGWWMDKNHVRMEGHLLPFLEARFQTEYRSVRPAWLGLWRYFVYVGVKQ